MLTENSRVELDALWNEFWPATDIKPFSVIDFINSIFFIRHLDELQQEKEHVAQLYNQPVDAPIYTEDQQNLRWAVLQQMDKNQLYQLFNRQENGVLQFARTTVEYKKWSRFDEEAAPLLAIPELLAATVKFVANLDAADMQTRAEMNHYLVKKVEEAKQKQSDALPATSPRINSANEQRSLLKVWNVAVILLVIFISGFAIAYFYFGTKNKNNAASIATNTDVDTAITPLLVNNQPVAETKNKKNTQAKKTESTRKSLVTKSKKTAAKNESGEAKGKYKIISKAYFHNEPDENTRRNAFVVHWNNAYATLTALDEENGFVYVVFRNDQNQTSKGWLRKKDLRPID